MVSLPMAFVAGIGLGVIEQLSLANFSGGTTELLVFGLMMVVLLARASTLARQHRRADDGAGSAFVERPRPLPPDLRDATWLPAVRACALAAVTVVALLLPLLPGL